MINKHIQCATFRVVAHIKGDCVNSAPLPRASLTGLWRLGLSVSASYVLWFC